MNELGQVGQRASEALVALDPDVRRFRHPNRLSTLERRAVTRLVARAARRALRR